MFLFSIVTHPIRVIPLLSTKVVNLDLQDIFALAILEIWYGITVNLASLTCVRMYRLVVTTNTFYV